MLIQLPAGAKWARPFPIQPIMVSDETHTTLRNIPDKYAQPNGSSVGADPCVRLAGIISVLTLVGRIRSHLETHPLLSRRYTFELPTTGGHIGPPLRGLGGNGSITEHFLVIQLPAGRNRQGRSLYSYYGLRRRPCYYPNKYAQPNGSSVGADPCVRPAGHNRRSHPRGANSHHLETHPLLSRRYTFELPTTGGHMGPPLRSSRKCRLYLSTLTLFLAICAGFPFRPPDTCCPAAL